MLTSVQLDDSWLNYISVSSIEGVIFHVLLYQKLYWTEIFYAFLFLKQFLWLLKSMGLAWHVWSTHAESCLVLYYHIFCFCFHQMLLQILSIPLNQLVIVALFFLGSDCDYAVLFGKHILILCNPIFFLRNNSTIIIFTVCAVIESVWFQSY